MDTFYAVLQFWEKYERLMYHQNSNVAFVEVLVYNTAWYTWMKSRENGSVKCKACSLLTGLLQTFESIDYNLLIVELHDYRFIGTQKLLSVGV